MNKSVIKLFKGVEIKTQNKGKLTKNLVAKTTKLGFVFAPEVVGNYGEFELNALIALVQKHFGLSGEQLNAGFHKSWKKIANASIEQLVLEQFVHYITTYGFESLGIYSENTVYVPHERLNIPALKENIPLIVIRGYTKTEIKQKLINLLSSGIALGTDTVNHCTNIAMNVGVDKNDLELVKNKETKMAFYEYLGLIPENPIEFLRFVIYKTTGKTLLIKDKATISNIQSSIIPVLPIFKRYEKENSLEKLSTIFYRNKPIFLAFRKKDGMRSVINKLRKLAVVYHKPMPIDLLNNVTSALPNGQKDFSNLAKSLTEANFFRKARIAHALHFRTQKNDSILYRVRNGKAFATSFSFDKQEKAKKALAVVNQSLLPHFTKFEGKTIHIPKNVSYALPTTEKQFVGEMPSGSSITLDKDMVIGVNWHNVNGNRIDLDLSLLSIDGKFGWDGMYRGGNNGANLLFSGDMTDAQGTHGATEAFYVSKQFNGVFLVVLNYFNYNVATPVPFKIFVASENVKDFGRNYLVNPNNISCIANTTISTKQKILGLLYVNDHQSKFTFAETSIGGAIYARNGQYMSHSRKYLLNYYQNQLNINDLLTMAGAKITSNPEKCDLNLSPLALEKDTLLKMVA